MRNVVDDKGSFTVEVSFLSIFIVMIIMNIIVLICVMYDKCVIYEEINKNIFLINEKKEKINIDKLEENKTINNKLLCVNVINVSYKLNEKNINVSITYSIKSDAICLFNYKQSYTINKSINLFDVKSFVRSA